MPKYGGRSDPLTLGPKGRLISRLPPPEALNCLELVFVIVSVGFVSLSFGLVAISKVQLRNPAF